MRIVNTTLDSLTGGGQVIERDEVRLDERVAAASLVRGRLDCRGAVVAQDSRVDATIETRGTNLRQSANPVVVDVLVSGEDERVALACVDLDFVHGERLVVDGIDLDDGHVVVVDGEGEVGVARNGDEAEAVAFALRHGDNGQVDRVTTSVPAKAVDKHCVGAQTFRQVSILACT